jgi:hypothetical protein
MDLSPHPVAQDTVNELLRPHAIQTLELVRYDHCSEMPAPVLCTRMSGMKVGLVDYLDMGCTKLVPETLFERVAHTH